MTRPFYSIGILFVGAALTVTTNLIAATVPSLEEMGEAPLDCREVRVAGGDRRAALFVCLRRSAVGDVSQTVESETGSPSTRRRRDTTDFHLLGSKDRTRSALRCSRVPRLSDGRMDLALQK